jgi:hypothetical protein
MTEGVYWRRGTGSTRAAQQTASLFDRFVGAAPVRVDCGGRQRAELFAAGLKERLRLLLSQQFRGSSDQPTPLVNIEFHQAFVSHFQQEGLAGLLIHDIGAFHDLIDFERLLAERAQDILSIIQHDCSLQTTKRWSLTLE